MQIAEAQRQVRSAYRGGMPGQLVSGALWLASAAVATWGPRPLAVLVLVAGGVLIFPLTLLALKLSGRPAGIPRGNPLDGLAMQVAFTVPLALPVVLALAQRDAHWFYPAMMIVVGAHYLPFVFLYGMPAFAVLGAALLAGGVLLGAFVPAPFATGGWLAGVLLAGAGLALGRIVAAEERREAAAAPPA